MEKPDYANDPVLSKIAPASFVDKLLSCIPMTQHTILEGLKTRYEAGQLRGPLVAEAAWVIEVCRELQKRLPELRPIRRYSLSNDTERLLGPALRDARGMQSDTEMTN